MFHELKKDLIRYWLSYGIDSSKHPPRVKRGSGTGDPCFSDKAFRQFE